MPPYCFYADDLIVYCNGRLPNLNAPREVLCRYSSCSGQFINADKSTIFTRTISHDRIHRIASLLGFQIGIKVYTYSLLLTRLSASSYFESLAAIHYWQNAAYQVHDLEYVNVFHQDLYLACLAPKGP